jgi:uncharacterized repeat protein (TIGR03803 family)
MNFCRFVLSTVRLLAIAFCVFLVSTSARAAGEEKVLYSFQDTPDGSDPIGSLVFGEDGSLYGSTFAGGASSCQYIGDCGTVYRLKPPIVQGDPWTETVLYVFKGANQNDGETGGGGVVFDAAGNLYGVTGFGGDGNCMLFGSRVGCGTVYELSPATMPSGQWTEKVLYSFQGGSDGQLPGGELVFDKLGNLYGATSYGGGFGNCNPPFEHCGIVFRLSPPKAKGGKWTEQVLYSFKGGKDGANPGSGLIFDSKGAIYGTTFAGGDKVCTGAGSVGCGIVYKLTQPPTKSGHWTERILYKFVTGLPDGGAGPNDSLVFDNKGHLYGTTVSGGNAQDGVAYELAKGGAGQWEEIVLYQFQNLDGWQPSGGVIFDAVGNLYGSASGGGSNGVGTLFRLHSARKNEGKWMFNLLHSFSPPPDGYDPVSHLIFDNIGNLYRITQAGGRGPCQGGCGTVFRFTPKK